MASQKWVEIRHPDIEKTAIVAAVSLPHHRKAGWEVVESTDAAPAQPQVRERPTAPARQQRPQRTEPQQSTTESEGTA